MSYIFRLLQLLDQPKEIYLFDQYLLGIVQEMKISMVQMTTMVLPKGQNERQAVLQTALQLEPGKYQE
jgi:hypothetical protein